jgi:hypothetical protein
MDRFLIVTFTRYIWCQGIEGLLVYVELSIFAKQNIDVKNSLRRNAGFSGCFEPERASVRLGVRTSGLRPELTPNRRSGQGYYQLDVDGAWTTWRSSNRVRIGHAANQGFDLRLVTCHKRRSSLLEPQYWFPQNQIRRQSRVPRNGSN